MLKITFYPNNKATVCGFYDDDGGRVNMNCTSDHLQIETIVSTLTKQNKEGTIEACIVVERKPGAYEIPKLERANSIFG